MQEIRFTIAPDGSVTSTVKGVKGGKCKDLTKQIEKALGAVTGTKNTPEHYEKDNQAQVKLGN